MLKVGLRSLMKLKASRLRANPVELVLFETTCIRKGLLNNFSKQLLYFQMQASVAEKPSSTADRSLKSTTSITGKVNSNKFTWFFFSVTVGQIVIGQLSV